jgi:RNA polymerase sigma factor (TIGR02999 family)
MSEKSDVTQVLKRWTEGEEKALDRLMPLVYDQLKRLAHSRLISERDDHTLNTTALVHEAYLRLVDADRIQWKDRAHFFALASRIMRRLLVDYAKKRNAAKRGGLHPHVPLEEERLVSDDHAERILELNESLEGLEREYPRQARAIEHRYFGGLTNAEIGAVLDVSHATVERDLRFARSWLARSLEHCAIPT